MPAADQDSRPPSPEDRRFVDTWLAEFDRSWNERRLAVCLQELPPAGNPLRLHLLLGMIETDLRRRWQQGQKVTIETYLKVCPELGTRETVPIVLVHAEVEARARCGIAADLADFAARFPGRIEELRKCIQQGRPATGVGPRTSGTLTASNLSTGPSSGPQSTRPSVRTFSVSGSLTEEALPEQFGRYRILRRLGRGGMGTVYLAEDTELSRQVALKVPRFRSEDGPTVRARFDREARVAASLHHPNLCPVYEVGEINGTRYLTMAFIDGKPLGRLLRVTRQFPERHAAALVRKLALTLAIAHDQGIVHRDLKPSNILITRSGEPVITDFGLARSLDPEEPRLTQQGSMLGTPAYMAPEQVVGDLEALGPCCDIYSLGVILYELLAGRLPFEGPTALVLARVVAAPLPPLDTFRPGVSPALAAICARALAKKPADRYATMRQFAAALTEYLTTNAPASGTEPAASPAAGTAFALPDSAEVLTADLANPAQSVEEPVRQVEWRPGLSVWLAVGAAAILVLTAALGLVLVLR